MARRNARTSRRRGKQKTGVLSVDFTGVSREGGGFVIPEGEYPMQLVAAEEGVGEESGEPLIIWDFKGTGGKAKGKPFRYWTSLQPQALWKLAGLLEAFGLEVPDSAMDIDLPEIVESEPEVIGVVENEEFRNKERSKLVDVINAGEEGEEEEEEKPKRGRSKKPVKVSADEVKEMDEEELQDLIDKHELDVDLEEHKTPRRKSAAVIAALEENDLIED